jgi:hypothetical protein
VKARLARCCRGLVVGALLVAEPVLHACGVPHPEGLSAFAVQVMSTR